VIGLICFCSINKYTFCHTTCSKDKVGSVGVADSSGTDSGMDSGSGVGDLGDSSGMDVSDNISVASLGVVASDVVVGVVGIGSMDGGDGGMGKVVVGSN
tara:strand:+ start:4140 stop:4436 length:297 start_codon:yes stop_codon:yes gene_type:complete